MDKKMCVKVGTMELHLESNALGGVNVKVLHDDDGVTYADLSEEISLNFEQTRQALKYIRDCLMDYAIWQLE